MCSLLSAPVHSVTLRDLIDASAQTHPSVLAAKFDADAAGDGVEIAKLQYWPTLSAQVDSGSDGSRLLRAEQTLWNGRYTEFGVRSAELGLSIARAKQQLQRQKLALLVGVSWQALWSAQGRLKVAESAQRQLTRFEEMMGRRVQAELSVGVELELVRARLLQSRVDATRAQADIQAAIERLEQLTGLRGLKESLGKLPVGQRVEVFDSSITRLQSAAAQMDDVVTLQPEVRLAREEARYSLQQVELRRAQASPQIYMRLDQYVSGERDTKAYIGLTYTTGAGFSAPLEVKALSKRAQGAEQSLESMELEIRQGLVLDMSELLNARQRLAALSDAVNGAVNVLDSYERQFVANRKSWQDLMNSVRELSQNETARVEAESQLVGAMLRVQLRVDPAAIDGAIAVGTGSKVDMGSHAAGSGSHGN